MSLAASMVHFWALALALSLLLLLAAWSKGK